MSEDYTKVGLAVMRTQPLHIGHCHIINRMIQECETVILGLGSADKGRTEENPFSIEQRMEMAKRVYGNRIKIVPLKDLGLTEVSNVWCDYVLDKLDKVGMPTPTEYYTGSEADSLYYIHHFNGDNLHLVDRNGNPVPSGTELRTMIQLGSDKWCQWVPEVNWDIVDDYYPDKFRIKPAAR